MRRRTMALLLMTSCGRDPAWHFELPTLADETRSVLIGLASDILPQGGSDPLSLYASNRGELEAEGLGFTFDAEPVLELTLLELPGTVETYGLASGVVPRTTEQNARPLPKADRIWVRSGSSGALGAWAPGDLPARIAELRLAKIDWVACFAAGGCRGALSLEDICDRPCPEAAAPDPPDLPEPPAPPAVLGPDRCSVSPLPTWAAAPLGACEPALAMATCGPGVIAWPSVPGCVAVGPEICPGPYAPAPMGRASIWVDPTAPAGGDGSSTNPIRSLSTAISTAPDRAVLLLKEGDHAGPVSIDRGLELLGACARTTRVTSFDPVLPAVTTTGVASVAHLTIEGRALGVDASGEVGLSSVVIVAPTGVRLALATRLRAQSTAIFHQGLGLDVGPGSVAELDRTLIDGRATGVLVEGTLNARGLVARRGTVEVVGGGRVDLRESVLEGQRGHAVKIGIGGRFFGQDLLVRDHGQGKGGSAAIGATPGSELELLRVDVRRFADYGVAIDSTATASVADLSIDGEATETSTAFTVGLQNLGVELEAHRIRIDRTSSNGLRSTSAARLFDVHVLRSGHAEVYARDCFYVAGTATIERFLGESCGYAGVISGSRSEPADIVARDLTVDGSAVGLFVGAGQVDLRRARLVNSGQAGLTLFPETRVEARDVHIQGVHNPMAQSINVDPYAELNLERYLLEDNAGIGLLFDLPNAPGVPRRSSSAKSGTIRRHRIGVEIRGAFPTEGDVLERLHFEEVELPLSF